MRSSNAYAIGWSNYSDLTRPHPKRWLDVREIPLFQGNLGWWNIIMIWPELVVCPKTAGGMQPSTENRYVASPNPQSSRPTLLEVQDTLLGEWWKGRQLEMIHWATRWWLHIFFYFHPYLGIFGEDSQFDEYFSDGLKPPTSTYFQNFQLDISKGKMLVIGRGIESTNEAVSGCSPTSSLLPIALKKHVKSFCEKILPQNSGTK